jgi:hypothetical protein
MQDLPTERADAWTSPVRSDRTAAAAIKLAGLADPAGMSASLLRCLSDSRWRCEPSRQSQAEAKPC